MIPSRLVSEVTTMETPYQVIARKYRPQTFCDVVGQEPIVTTLKNALRSRRLAHAYLFCGCRGTGKTTLARILAKAINCKHLTEYFEPCNMCPSCLDIISGRSLDVLEIDGASNRGIDDIRQINETVGYAPTMGHYKIYIIDEVHMLTKEAFNALLKTLEEPPAHVKFFFATTEPHKIPPTILSRCQRFDLRRIGLDMIKQKLLKIVQDLHIVCDEETLSCIATLSEGSLRDAESLLDQIICYAEPPITFTTVAVSIGVMPKTAFFALDNAFTEQQCSFAFELANEVFASGKDFSYFLDQLLEHYRTLLKLKLDPQHSPSTTPLDQRYHTSLALYTQEQCLYILDFLMQTQQHSSKIPFKRVHLEMLLLHIIRSKHRLTLPALVKRLQELEKQIDNPSLDEQLINQLQKKLNDPPSQTPASSFPLLSKEQWEAKTVPEEQKEEDKLPFSKPVRKQSPPATTAAPSQEVISLPSTTTPIPSNTKDASPPTCNYDTLVRFAAVELEGIIKNLTK